MTDTQVGAVLALLVGAPLLLAGVTTLAGATRRWPAGVLVVALVAQVGVGVALVLRVRDGGAVGHGVGGWSSGIAIPFVVDMLSALMLTVTALLTMTCVLFALASGTGRIRMFAPLVLVVTAGVNGALLTADLFNMFVFIEVMLLPSYGLLVLAQRERGTMRSVTGSRLYVTFNLFVSTVFLAGVALVYGVVGTVNLGELAGAAQESTLVAATVAICLVALGMKAGVAPMHGWLPRAYPSTSPAVTALFSALHTKVAIYAIYRIYAVVFDGDERYLWIGLVVFSATMVVGVLGALGEGWLRSILAFQMVSGVGYILVGVGLFTASGLSAGIAYMIHHMIVMCALLLAAGAVEAHYGTGRLDSLRGGVRREPLLAVAFGFAALSLAGLPPFSGFLVKLALVVSAAEEGRYVVVALVLGVSVLTLLSMLTIWNALFAKPADVDEAAGAGAAHGAQEEVAPDGQVAVLTARRTRMPLPLVLPALGLAAVSLGLGVGGELLLDLSSVAADGLVDTSTYVRAVLGGQG